MKKQNLFLMVAVLVLAVIPLLFIKPAKEGEEIFSGSDDKATAMITTLQPDYKPWFSPLWEPPSGEIESLLFALQAAIGAGAVGYAVGLFRGRKPAASVK